MMTMMNYRAICAASYCFCSHSSLQSSSPVLYSYDGVCACVCRYVACCSEQREAACAGRETYQLGKVGASRREHCMGQGHSQMLHTHYSHLHHCTPYTL